MGNNEYAEVEEYEHLRRYYLLSEQMREIVIPEGDGLQEIDLKAASEVSVRLADERKWLHGRVA